MLRFLRVALIEVTVGFLALGLTYCLRLALDLAGGFGMRVP